MPEMHFLVRWPDGQETRCYSPSLVIEEHLAPGARYPVAEFVRRSSAALAIASDRVQAKYGMACTRALGHRAEIERRAAHFVKDDAVVEILAFERLT